MRDFYEIGSVPNEEDCCQLGLDGYDEFGRKECDVYARQIQRKHGEPPSGCYLRVKGNQHDFGTYYEVVVNYDDDDRAGLDYALLLEGNSPATWDDDKPVAPKPKDDGPRSGDDRNQDEGADERADEEFDPVYRPSL